MLDRAHIMAFVATADADRSRAFYRDVLGMPLVAEHEFAIVFDVQGVELRIQKVVAVEPQSHTVLGWAVPSIVDAVRTLTDKGVRFETFDGLSQDPLGIWSPVPGVKVAWFKDPDGNLLSLTEKPPA